MNDAEQLLTQLESLGVRLSAEGERLRVNAGQGQLSDMLKARIAQYKPELLSLLCGRHPAAVPAPTAAPEGEFPLSFAQRRLWFLDRLEPSNNAYNLGATHFIAAAVDAGVMKQAIDDVCWRQAALRTVIRDADGEPVQVVLPFEPRPLPLIDLRDLPEAEHAGAWRQHVLQEAGRPFDLARGPLFRATLIRWAPERHHLLFTMHHIVGDGWSLGIFLEDLKAAYQARLAGRAPEQARLTLHFGPHAAAERARLQGPALEPLLDYWRKRLAGAPPMLELPTDRPRPSQRSFAGASVPFTLTRELSDALRALARAERTTPYMTLLALFKALLYRISGQGDIVVGTPVANRPTPEHERLIGMFTSTLPVRSVLGPQTSLRALVAQIRENVIEDQAHGELPFEKMVDELRPERSMAWSPIFQVVFALQNMPLSSAFEVSTVAAMYDLSLFMWDEPAGIRGTFEFGTALFDIATVQRWRDHLVTLAEAVVATPLAMDKPISRLPLMDDAARSQVLRLGSATARPYDRDATLHVLFQRAALSWPDAVALQSAEPANDAEVPQHLTYAELSRGVAAVAHALQDAGVRRGDRVALYMDRSVEAIAAILAIVAAGAAYVPLDPGDPLPRVKDIADAAAIRVVLTLRKLSARVRGLRAARCLTMHELWPRDGAVAATPAPQPAQAAQTAQAGELAYVMFTSGTTGKPKGVCITHRNVARLVCNPDYVELDAGQVLLQLAPLTFDAATLEIWGALLNGARLVVHPPRLSTARELAQVLRRHRVSTLWLTAGLFHHMVEQEVHALASVRQVLAGGDVLSTSHVQRLLDAKLELGREAGGVVINGYGPTENTTFTCCHRMVPGDRLVGTVPIGRPIANTTVYLLDEPGEPVPPGVAGELFTGGDGVANGYLAGAAKDTAARFLPDPFASRPGATMYRTGDLARWRADGSIEFLGRRDRQVKVRGFRIELEEIEDALRRCPAVRDAAVVVRRDAADTNALVAYLVPRPGHRCDDADIKAALAERLPGYMIPGSLVELPRLPLTANGKLDRTALPEPDIGAAAESLVEPRTPVEAQLLAIWERVLGRTGFGVTDNFFALGGHSLLAVRLFSQVEQAFAMKLPVSALFAAPDVAQLAKRLQSEGFASPWSTLVPIRPEGHEAPLFLVPGIGGNVVCYGELARHLAPGQPLYGLQSRGLDEVQEPFECIEPMAAHYLSEVRRLQPHGPYRLGGTCFGGVVAYEMAQQLRAAGETVNALFLLESWPPPRRRALGDAFVLHSHQLRFLALAAKRNLKRLWRTPLRQWRRTLASVFAIACEIAAKRDVYRGDRATMYVDRVSLANQRALAAYKPKPYDGALRFACATGRRFSGEDARAVWRRLAPADYAQLDIDASDSGSMLLPPHVESLTRWMNQELADLQRCGEATAREMEDRKRHAT